MSIDVYPPRSLTQYEEGSFTVTAMGFSGTAPSGTARYIRIGNQVTLTLPTLGGTSNATTLTYTGMPSALWPVATPQQEFFVRGTTSTDHISVIITLSGDGIIYFSPLPSLAWSASGTKGIAITTITYSLR